ncbi:hypothetical protein BJ741DRAFT_579128 [Chytriomyces cf. hyalinus JEL632]|nr:hypothetical protein BJ741DRAFT_579128 [Chytriomyces cf. hyalinus JEL632]
MEEALADAEALRCVCYGGILISTHAAAHMLLHMITTDDGQYQFLHEALASKYVGEKLWDKHARHMITNFERVFPATPVIVLRHLFKIYGHRVFSSGGFSAENGLQCQNLQTNETSILALQDFGGVRVNLKQDSFPDKSIMQYLERSDDDQFPDIDSLSPHGLFLFVVGAERPLQEAETLRQLYGLYGNPKLYFVVPPQRFTKFAKQELVRRALKIWSRRQKEEKEESEKE